MKLLLSLLLALALVAHVRATCASDLVSCIGTSFTPGKICECFDTCKNDCAGGDATGCVPEGVDIAQYVDINTLDCADVLNVALGNIPEACLECMQSFTSCAGVTIDVSGSASLDNLDASVSIDAGCGCLGSLNSCIMSADCTGSNGGAQVADVMGFSLQGLSYNAVCADLSGICSEEDLSATDCPSGEEYVSNTKIIRVLKDFRAGVNAELAANIAGLVSIDIDVDNVETVLSEGVNDRVVTFVANIDGNVDEVVAAIKAKLAEIFKIAEVYIEVEIVANAKRADQNGQITFKDIPPPEDSNESPSDSPSSEDEDNNNNNTDSNASTISFAWSLLCLGFFFW